MRRFGTLVAVVGLLAGCAPVAPAWSGGSTTPHERHDLALGGAVRVPLGMAADDVRHDAQGGAAPTGIAPVAMYRLGLPEHWDLGLAALGAGGRLEARREHVLEEASTRKALVYGVSVDALWVSPPERDAAEPGTIFLSAQLPLVYGLDVGGIFEGWFGARLRAGAVRAPTQIGSDSTWNALLAAEALVGIAAGFRRVHAFAELAAGYEWWSVLGGVVVLTPSFGLRLRI